MSKNPGSITLDDYLHRNYENERECEYIDGFLIERTGGEYPHSSLHGAAAAATHAEILRCVLDDGKSGKERRPSGKRG